VGKKLGLLNEPGRFWVTAVTRFGAAEVVRSDMVGQEGDVVHLVAAVDALEELDARLSSPEDA